MKEQSQSLQNEERRSINTGQILITRHSVPGMSQVVASYVRLLMEGLGQALKIMA